MKTRAELHELVDYSRYDALEQPYVREVVLED